MPLTFFLEVKWNWTLPFWQHPTLVPLEGNLSDAAANSSHSTLPADDDKDEQELSGVASDEDDAKNIVDTEVTPWACDGGTYRERLVDNIKIIQDFCDGLEY